MDFSDQALVLHVGKFREADLWVRFLSPKRGLFTAFAFGGSRSRRRFIGCLDIFNEISVRVSASGRTSHLALQEGVLIKGVNRLRRDWSRFGLAVNCARFLQTFGVGPEEAEGTLFLMRGILQLLEDQETVPRLLPLFFRLRLAFDQGYALEASHCFLCGAPATSTCEAAYLLLREGRIVCRSCIGKQQNYRLPLGIEALSIVTQVKELPPSGWSMIEPSPLGAREFARAVDGFIEYHVGIAWDRGRFIRH